MEAVCVIQIAMLPTGDIKFNAQGGNVPVQNWMLDVAKRLLMDQTARKPEDAPKIQIADPALTNRLGLNGK
jgi:hypothetical protein